jgi:hypothetical protein
LARHGYGFGFGFGFALAHLRKTAFLSHLYIKTIILPRQARDKHRENTQKRCRFPHTAIQQVVPHHNR